ncbi:MAG: zf-HC2 domain-containing protein [Bacteroidetes bacterium]|nr:zf-HC2 domain-containing protein [Bacteroidota bacterium]
MDNSCRFSVYVDDFVHGELEQSQRKSFEDHLASCGECRKELEAALRLKESLTASYLADLDETFNYKVINTLRTDGHFERGKEIRVALEDIVISLATLVAVVLLAIQMFRTPSVTTVDMLGRLTNIEKSSLEQPALSNDQVLELVLRRK